MKDEQYTPALGTWLKDSDVPPPDPHASARRIMAELPELETTRRWWPFSHFGPQAQRPTATTYQRNSTTATSVRTPTIIGRTQSMLNPAKVITAGALVFALGGVMLIAQPWGEQERGLPAAVTDEPHSIPIEVTGDITCGPAVRIGTTERTFVQLADGRLNIAANRGDAWRQTATMSDPRLTGTYYASEDSDEFRVPGASGISIASYTRRIENDDGAWQGSDTYAYLSDGSSTAISTVLVGEGAYEGLRVIWEELWEEAPAPDYCTAEVRGVIIDGDVPEAGEPFSRQ